MLASVRRTCLRRDTTTLLSLWERPGGAGYTAPCSAIFAATGKVSVRCRFAISSRHEAARLRGQQENAVPRSTRTLRSSRCFSRMRRSRDRIRPLVSARRDCFKVRVDPGLYIRHDLLLTDVGKQIVIMALVQLQRL